ncbi:glycoside hydrolase family 104 protein [Stenotrophomonas sp. GD03680]|uniref:glycoside hydrolase family 24 protein n=1 Tax=Stenotrophomonas sp. GD03680 TaxID=2975365 RepID=UPI00244BD534|nr:glycoside hydrolase family 104 protein [Stenotrophomonas sp. GD03680]MDH2022931.1 glycoside hydrolase family 104 protein [Stenotrophomonas sp. GD03680]
MTSAPEITPAAAGGVNVCAFLSMLAWSEGTDNGKQPTKDRGYDVIVGGQLFKSYADHPRVLVDLPKLKIQSTAAGRYQLLRRYFDAYKKTLGLKDFSPLSQDLIALQQIRERHALPLIQAGKIEDAIKAVRKIWASLPGAGYGQHEQKLADLLAVYSRAGGTVAP